MTTPKVNQLFKMDIQFCEDVKKSGAKAWMKYQAEDSIMGTGKHDPYIKGAENMAPLMEKFFQIKDLDFTWYPEIGFMSEDETFGVTSGKYTRRYHVNGELQEQIGKYMTVWKKINGEWKIVFDMGN